MPRFDKDMLPVLGVKWVRFATASEASRFARWAESETRRDQYPCEAFVTRDNDADPSERWEVKVRNW